MVGFIILIIIGAVLVLCAFSYRLDDRALLRDIRKTGELDYREALSLEAVHRLERKGIVEVVCYDDPARLVIVERKKNE